MNLFIRFLKKTSKQTFNSLFILICILSVLIGCISDEPDNQTRDQITNNTPYTSNTVKLAEIVSSTSDKANVLKKVSTPTDCTYISDNYASTGTCVTPISVTGYAEQVHIDKVNGSVPGGTRLLGENEHDETPGAIFSGTEFDLSNPTALQTNNTLSLQYESQEIYDTLRLSTAWYKIKFPLNVNSGTKTVTMLLAKYSQPFAESDAITNAISQCNMTTQQATQSQYSNADLLPGLRFQRGDYLFCVKDNETDVCAASDYQWLNTANNALVSSRPTTPKSSHWLSNNAISCQSDGENEGESIVNFDFGPFGIYSNIEEINQFKLWSDYSHGELSNQWPDAKDPLDDSSTTDDSSIAWVSPYYIYYHQDCSSNTCGTTQEGTDLAVTLTIDMASMIIIDGLTPDNIEATDNIGNVLLKTHLKTQWAFDQRSKNSIVGYDANHMVSTNVNASITVSGNMNTPPDGSITRCTDKASNELSESPCADSSE